MDITAFSEFGKYISALRVTYRFYCPMPDDFTLSKARQSSKGDPLGVKGLNNTIDCSTDKHVFCRLRGTGKGCKMSRSLPAYTLIPPMKKLTEF